MSDKEREPWWTWNWDTKVVQDATVRYVCITRWRRGSFLTVYRKETKGDVNWWIYLPFNIGLGFSYPVEVDEDEDDEGGAGGKGADGGGDGEAGGKGPHGRGGAGGKPANISEDCLCEAHKE